MGGPNAKGGIREVKLVYVEWMDACAVAHWQPEPDLEEWIENGSPIICQVGWIYKETPKYIVLVGRYGTHIYDGDAEVERSYGLVQKIPKTWIRVRKELQC